MSWLKTYIAICASILLLIIVALILLVTFGDMGLSGNGIAALFIGVIATVLLTMILMGLVFVSNRGGRDATVYDAGQKKSSEKKRHSRYDAQDSGPS